MEENFKIEIISPEKIIFSSDVSMVTIPSYEGDMSILKNHISIITFLRPGIIKVKKKDDNFVEFFAQDGTIEFNDNNMIILSSSAIDVKDLSKDMIEDLNLSAQKKLDQKDITDHDRYILSHKLDILKTMRV